VDFFRSGLEYFLDEKPHGVMNVPKIWKHSKDVAKVEPQLHIANCVIYTAPRRDHSPTKDPNYFHLWTLLLRLKVRKYFSVQIVSKIE